MCADSHQRRHQPRANEPGSSEMLLGKRMPSVGLEPNLHDDVIRQLLRTAVCSWSARGLCCVHAGTGGRVLRRKSGIFPRSGLEVKSKQFQSKFMKFMVLVDRIRHRSTRSLQGHDVSIGSF